MLVVSNGPPPVSGTMTSKSFSEPMTAKKIDEPDHRPEQRQGDVPETLEAAGPVHLGRLEQRPVDALQARDVEHRVEAEIFPQDDDQDRAERPGLVGEEIIGLEAERAGDHARQSVAAVEHEMPDQAGGHVGEDIGQEEDHPEHSRAGDPPGHHQRHGERERLLDEERDGDDEAVVDERAVEGRVADQVAVILQSDEFLGPAVSVPVEEAVVGGLRDRQRDEHGEEEKRRRQKDDDDRPSVGGHAPGGFDIGRLNC